MEPIIEDSICCLSQQIIFKINCEILAVITVCLITVVSVITAYVVTDIAIIKMYIMYDDRHSTVMMAIKADSVLS